MMLIATALECPDCQRVPSGARQQRPESKRQPPAAIARKHTGMVQKEQPCSGSSVSPTIAGWAATRPRQLCNLSDEVTLILAPSVLPPISPTRLAKNSN